MLTLVQPSTTKKWEHRWIVLLQNSFSSFADCFDKVEELVEIVCTDQQLPTEIIIAGDFNFAFNPMSELLNQNSANQDRSLANLVS